MRKIITAVLPLFLLFTLPACGPGVNGSGAGNNGGAFGVIRESIKF